MKKFIPILAVAVVLLIGGAIFISRSHPSDNGTSPATDQATNGSSSSSQSSSSGTCPTPPPNTVSYCNGKFNDLTVPAGTQVTFRNDSSQSVQPDSNPHPAHTDNPELNVGFLGAGQSKTVTLNAKGTWGIHNHLDESQMAKITVQ